MFLTLLYPVVLGAALRVQSDVSCPSPSEVSANLQAIVDLAEGSTDKVYATLKRDGAWLEIELSRADGVSLGERSVETADQDCALLARTAAVVLAAWLSGEHPEFLVALPTSGSQDSLPKVRASSSAEAVPRLVETPSAPVETPKIEGPHRQPSRPNKREERGHRLALDAAIGAEAAIGDSSNRTLIAPAAWFGAAWDPVKSGFGVRVGVALIGPRSDPLGDRHVRWTRWPLLAGPYLRLGQNAQGLEVGLGPALGWLRLEGQSFSPNVAHSTATLGSYAEFRYRKRLAAFDAFVVVTPILWLGHSTAYADIPTGRSERDLASFEFLLAAGLVLPL